eukprot:GHVR01006440.1.p1 GENE.GHVR01006440.1~~GHVR01006440.1.p1  ORF type:complete len:110 (-),score=0.97 GHVR01006440.1:138-467(-)
MKIIHLIVCLTSARLCVGWLLINQFTDPDANKINAIDASADGTKIVTGSQSGKVTIWSALTYDSIHVYTGYSTLFTPIYTVKFSKDSSLIAISGNNNKIRVIQSTSPYT